MQKNSSMPACASCKHQRKKCTDKCVLAPFFPAEKSREFQAVHKVFGVSNVTKIVNNLREEDRKRAIDSLVWEAFWRQRDPVLGPYGEYRKVNEELKFYKSQFQHLQAAAQGSMVYKPTPCLVGWNNNGITKNGTGIGCGDNQSNAILNYVHSNGSSIIDSTPPYNYSSNHHHHHFHGMERTTQEEDAGSVVILPQQHSIDGLNQQYYLSVLLAENS